MQWLTAALVRNVYAKKCPKRLHEMMTMNEYSIRRTGQTHFFDSSKRKIRKQAIGNRIDNVIKRLDNSWKSKTKKDEIRTYLKKFLLK